MTKTIVRTRDIESQTETRVSLLKLLREPVAEPKGTLTLARRNGGELLAPWTWPLSLVRAPHAQRPAPVLRLVFRPSPPATQAASTLRLKGQARKTYPMTVTKDADQGAPIELEVPYGTPRYVNVATFRKLLGASWTNVLLRKVGALWEPYEDDAARIDLMDPAQVFRLGEIQIFS